MFTHNIFEHQQLHLLSWDPGSIIIVWQQRLNWSGVDTSYHIARQDPLINELYIAIEIWREIRFTLIPFLDHDIATYFLHATTAQKLCHMHNFVVINSSEFRWRQNENFIELINDG